MRRSVPPFLLARAHQEPEYLQRRRHRVLRSGQGEDGSIKVLAPLCRFAVSLRFGNATEKPIKAYVKRISDITKTVKWKMDRSDVEIPSSVCGEACSLRDFPRGQSLRSACIVKSGRKQSKSDMSYATCSKHVSQRFFLPPLFVKERCRHV